MRVKKTYHGVWINTPDDESEERWMRGMKIIRRAALRQLAQEEQEQQQEVRRNNNDQESHADTNV